MLSVICIPPGVSQNFLKEQRWGDTLSYWSTYCLFFLTHQFFIKKMNFFYSTHLLFHATRQMQRKQR